MKKKRRTWVGRLLEEFKKDPVVIMMLIPIAVVMVPIWISMDTIADILEVFRSGKTR